MMQLSRPDAPTDDSELSPDRLRRRDLRAMLAMLSAATEIAAQTDAELRDDGSGLRASEWDVLVMLHAYGPQRPAAIARHAALSVNAPTVHAILGRLQSRGLVSRASHPEHRRAVLVEITPDGVELVDQVFPVLDRKVIGRFAAHFDSSELDTLIDLLERI